MKNFLREHWPSFLGILSFILLASMCMSGCGSPRVNPPKPGDGNQTIDTLLAWLVAFSIFGIGASVVAAVLLPLKKLAAAGFAGFGAILGTALLASAARPYLPYVALVLLFILAAWAILAFRKHVLATRVAVDFGCLMERAETPEDVANVKAICASAQNRLGVKKIIDTTLTKLKTKEPEKTKV